jgi:putative MATE family efflux protein
MAISTAPASGAIALDDRTPIARQVLLLAWPVVVQSLMRTLMFLVDTALLGHYGEGAEATRSLAATAILWPISNTFAMVLAAVGTGALAIVARAKGEGDPAKVERESATAMAASLAVGLCALPVAIFGFPFLAGLLGRGQDPHTVDLAKGFLFWTALSIPATMLEVGGSAALRGAGDTRMPMVFALIANILNAFGNWVLIFGKFGFPEMGVVGAGIATAICLALQGLMTLAWMHLPWSAVQLRLASYASVTRESIARLARVTGPAVVEPLLLQAGFLIFIRILSTLGEDAIAAHRTAVAVESLAFMPGFGFAVACGALVGQCLGARRPDRAELGFRASALYALGIMCTFAVLFLVFARGFVGVLAPKATPAVLDQASTALRISAAELPFLAAAMVLGGALRGAGDTRSPLVVAFVGVWLIRVPLGYVLAVPMKWGLAGAWAVMIVDWAARAGIFWLLWKRGRWKTLKL